MNKEGLRKIFKRQRLLLEKSECEYLSNSFFNFFKKSILDKNIVDFKNKIVAGYISFDNELDILKILEYLKDYYDCKICMPVVVEAGKPLKFREYKFNEDFLKNNENLIKLKEPNISCKELMPNIIFVPALSVDINRNRVGYGKGYYDRTINSMKNIISISTVYDFQIIENIETDEFDKKVNYIVSENRILKV